MPWSCSQRCWALLAIHFDQPVVDDLLLSTAFFTASAADVVEGFLWSPPSPLCTNVSLTQCTGYRVLLTTIIHQSSCLGSKGPQIYGSQSELQRGCLLLCSATIRTFSWYSKGLRSGSMMPIMQYAKLLICTENSSQIYINIPVEWY